LGRHAAVHAAALVRPSVIVALEVGIKHHLHLRDGLEPGAPALDAEVLVEQGAMQALDDAVALRPDVELQEQLLRMAVRPAAETRGRCRSAPPLTV
jgi:hypothetical protein